MLQVAEVTETEAMVGSPVFMERSPKYSTPPRRAISSSPPPSVRLVMATSPWVMMYMNMPFEGEEQLLHQPLVRDEQPHRLRGRRHSRGARRTRDQSKLAEAAAGLEGSPAPDIAVRLGDRDGARALPHDEEVVRVGVLLPHDHRALGHADLAHLVHQRAALGVALDVGDEEVDRGEGGVGLECGPRRGCGGRGGRRRRGACRDWGGLSGKRRASKFMPFRARVRVERGTRAVQC